VVGYLVEGNFGVEMGIIIIQGGGGTAIAIVTVEVVAITLFLSWNGNWYLSYGIWGLRLSECG
jgi:hypothetical protein